jgi:two-component system, NtrC family, response regulator AtoC
MSREDEKNGAKLVTTVASGSGPGDREPPPRYLLATLLGGMQLHELPVEGETSIGRGPECQIVLDDASISRQHARLRIGGTCSLTDLGSRNGTLLRGEWLRLGDERQVFCGDSFSMGRVSVFLLPPNASPAAEQLTGSRLRINDVEADASSPLVSSVAHARLNVLIYGETGVGKELLAQAIHRQSKRTGLFVAVNCAALTESLLESELFGHERGAFTGAMTAKPGLFLAATGGTLLLDEIGEMSSAIQAKILRAIETQTILPVGGVRPVPIDVRFLAATHRNLLAQVEQGGFRRDLYYRLAGFAFEILPLRERRHQIPKIAMQILTDVATRTGSLPPTITPGASAVLQAHSWPGNVRELRNVVERAMLLGAGGSIDVGHLLFDADSSAITGTVDGNVKPEPAPLDDERTRILSALNACAGSQTRAARMLHMSRATLVQKIRLYRLPRPRKSL